MDLDATGGGDLTQPDKAQVLSCAMCTCVTIAGEVQFVRLHRGAGEPWREVSVLSTHRLCAPCLRFANGAIGAPLGERLGVTASPTAPGGSVTSGCETCEADLSNEAYAVDIVPHQRRFKSRGPGRIPIARHVGDLRKQIVCPLCRLWILGLVLDSSSFRGAAARESEGAPGQWSWTVSADAVSVNLAAPDRTLLARTVEAMGGEHTSVRSVDLRGAMQVQEEIFFIGCTTRNGAARIVQRLPAGLRARTVGVARLDTLADAEALVAMGVAEILASPLSPHQVIGAMERNLRGGAAPPARLGVPRHVIRVSVEQGTELRQLLQLRRLIRGFDHVVPGKNGTLELTLYCPGPYVEAVLRRFHRLLGAGVHFAHVRSAAGNSFHAA